MVIGVGMAGGGLRGVFVVAVEAACCGVAGDTATISRRSLTNNIYTNPAL